MVKILWKALKTSFLAKQYPTTPTFPFLLAKSSFAHCSIEVFLVLGQEKYTQQT